MKIKGLKNNWDKASKMTAQETWKYKLEITRRDAWKEMVSLE